MRRGPPGPGVQLDLVPGGLPDPGAATRGRHHRRPQPTERAQAERVWPRTGTLRLKVLEAIMASPAGLTDYEISLTTGVYLYSAAPRRTELLKGGWVEDTGLRRPTGNGGEGIVWRATMAARLQGA